MGADLLAFRLGTGALVGELIILNLRLHYVGLVILHHTPEAVRHPVTMPDLMILDHRSGLDNAFRAADLVQSLGI
jgi:hypothetical protein